MQDDADNSQKASAPPPSPVVESERDALLDSHMLEQFAHAVAFGVPVPQALQQAGYKNTTAALGYSLLKQPRVTDIIEEDKRWLREKMAASQEQIVAQLDNDRSFAYAMENAGAAVAATMAKAKVLGMADPHAVKGGAPKRVIIEWGDEDQDPLEVAKIEAASKAILPEEAA